jgi:outer membrane protein assembly factor BamD
MHRLRSPLALLAAALLVLGGCARRKKYENPIQTNSQQPDKILFDRAIADIERSRFEVARLTLQTLINTYPDSEYIAKSKLAIADSWYRQGGSHALAQAEAEYKDFITFFPGMEEAVESQKKVCEIHYKQMEKPDRDPLHALKAEAECRQALLQFPNSKFVPEIEQMLREIQEVIAEGEFRVGRFYSIKGSYRAAATRLSALTERYPLYSKADEALWMLGEAYSKMGRTFEEKSARAYARLVSEYPLSSYVKDAKDRLAAMNRPIPDPDPEALARQQFELDNRGKIGLFGHAFGIFSKRPNVKLAARSGKPNLTIAQPVTPEGLPVQAGAAGATGVSAEVGATTITGPSALDTQPDARSRPPSAPPAQPPAAAEPRSPAGTSGPPSGAAASAPPAPAAENGAGSGAPSQPAESTSKKKKKGRFLGVIPRP